MERRERRAGIAEKYRADISHERRASRRVGKGYAVIARVRLGDPRVLSGLLPVEAAVDDHAADRRAMTADELRRGVNDDVSAPLERSHEIRRSES